MNEGLKTIEENINDLDVRRYRILALFGHVNLLAHFVLTVWLKDYALVWFSLWIFTHIAGLAGTAAYFAIGKYWLVGWDRKNLRNLFMPYLMVAILSTLPTTAITLSLFL